MARRRAFTNQAVIDAAHALIAENKPINGTSLRNKTESGRPDALMKVYLELEETGQIVAPTEPIPIDAPLVSQELPIEVAEKLSVMLADVERLVHHINDHAHHIVEQRLNTAIAEANERAVSAAKREAESTEEQGRAFEQLEDALDAHAELEERLSDVNKENGQLNALLDVARSETRAAQELVNERDARLTQQRQQLDDMQQQLTRANAAQAKAQGQVESVTQQLKEKSQECKVTAKALLTEQKALAKAESYIDTLKKQASQHSKELATSTQTQADLRKNLDTANMEMAVQQEKSKSLIAQRTQIEQKLDEQKTIQSQSQQRNEFLESELSKREQHIAELNKQLRDAEKAGAELQGALNAYKVKPKT